MSKLYCSTCEQDLNFDTIKGHQMQGHAIVAVFQAEKDTNSPDKQTAQRTDLIGVAARQARGD